MLIFVNVSCARLHTPRVGGDAKNIAESAEVETDSPKLAEAVVACRTHSAKLIIAKLDRLARDVAFVSSALEEAMSVPGPRLPPRPSRRGSAY
jgi:hypothetical protein